MLNNKILYFFIISVTLQLSCLANDDSLTFPMPVKYNGKIGYIDNTFNCIIPPRFSEGSAFSEGFATIKKDEFWGFINLEGEIEYIEDLDFLGMISNNYAPYRKKLDFGYINSRGEKLKLDFKIYSAGSFSEGLAAVKLEQNKWTYINSDGEFAFKNKFFKTCSEFKDGLAVVSTDSGSGLINKHGDYLIMPLFYSIENDFSEDLCFARTNDEGGYINKNGEFVIKGNYYHGYPFYDGVTFIAEGFMASSLFWKIINSDGKVRFSDSKIRMAGPFSDGVSSVLIENNDGVPKSGYMNGNGEFIISPIFDRTTDFQDGYAKVYMNNEEGIINLDGEVIWVKDIFSRCE